MSALLLPNQAVGRQLVVKRREKQFVISVTPWPETANPLLHLAFATADTLRITQGACGEFVLWVDCDNKQACAAFDITPAEAIQIAAFANLHFDANNSAAVLVA